RDRSQRKDRPIPRRKPGNFTPVPPPDPQSAPQSRFSCHQRKACGMLNRPANAFGLCADPDHRENRRSFRKPFNSNQDSRV
ncbi:MAG: hypothetical protein ACU0E9_00630, partial [Limimaricola soesokkakensis]|uniref:hypothetical protein n=1 Tax=Limimaricola soesokkakensis TaxID=1343159 RepID=UPI004059B04E